MASEAIQSRGGDASSGAVGPASEPIHIVNISGGKDSTATLLKAKERAERRQMTLRAVMADTENEHQITYDYVDYLEQRTGIKIEKVKADFSGRFAARREAIARDWPKELRRLQHTRECRARREALPKTSRGCRPSQERMAALKEWLGLCQCPTKVSPPLPDWMVRQAIEMMQPTGNAFLDMAMLHGRFPGSQTRFCTEQLKITPINELVDAIRHQGIPVIQWLGERAQESEARAAKPIIERHLCTERAPLVFYRPIHGLTHREVFEIAKRHGIKPNPLYTMGFSRVGCFCIMSQKEEVRQTANQFPGVIDRIRRWELIVGGVARHAYTALLRGERAELVLSFLPTDKVPPDANGMIRATIDRAVEWSRTSRGGRNYDLLVHLDDIDADEQPSRCQSAYGLCE